MKKETFGRPKWHLLDVLKVPSIYRGMRIVYKYDDGFHDDFNVSEELPIEYYDWLWFYLAHSGWNQDGGTLELARLLPTGRKNAVLGECIWDLSYNERRMGIELELTLYLEEEPADALINQFPVSADFHNLASYI